MERIPGINHQAPFNAKKGTRNGCLSHQKEKEAIQSRIDETSGIVDRSTVIRVYDLFLQCGTGHLLNASITESDVTGTNVLRAVPISVGSRSGKSKIIPT